MDSQSLAPGRKQRSGNVEIRFVTAKCALQNLLHLCGSGVEKKFPFAERLASGNSLFVGEENFSFSLSLMRQQIGSGNTVVSTVYEDDEELMETARANRSALQQLGVRVCCNVDARRLLQSLGGALVFETIIFQFPNVASRQPIDGRTANFSLLRDFLISARDVLAYDGYVLVTLVDNSYYNGVFQPDYAAHKAGYYLPEKYAFSPYDYPGYTHAMTQGGDSIIENYSLFQTLVFKPRRP